MKRAIVIIISVLFLYSCADRQKAQESEAMLEDLRLELELLKEESISKDSAIVQFFGILNEIEENLGVIREREGIISKDAFRTQELRDDVRERINDDIQLINDLMVKNRQSIRKLNQLIEQSNLNIEEFSRRLELATQMIEERDKEILEIKMRLADMDFSIQVLNATIDTLSWERERLQQEIKRQTTLLNTAWYAYGTRRELLENEIIVRSGGFLGIGRSFRLMDNFNEEYFTEVDITITKTIPLFSKKATVLTSHPSESYALVRNDQGTIQAIEVLDEKHFWSASRYLVILVD